MNKQRFQHKSTTHMSLKLNVIIAGNTFLYWSKKKKIQIKQRVSKDHQDVRKLYISHTCRQGLFNIQNETDCPKKQERKQC